MNGARTGEPGRRRPQNERRSYSKWPSPTTRQLSHGSVPEPAMEKGARAEGERERPGRPRSGEHVAGMRTRRLAARFHTHHRRFAHADAHAAASHGREGKIERLHRTPAGSTALAFDGTGLCDQWPARPAKDASYPVSVRQVTALLHTSFRRHLAMTPLCFASPSPPSGWTGDFHPQAIDHAGHTTKSLPR